MRKTIHTHGEVWGLHRWPNAKRPVDFLSASHAHRFTIEAEVEVHHSDRDLEFILLGRFLELQLRRFSGQHVMAPAHNRWSGAAHELIDFGDASCETMAEFLATTIQGTFGQQRYVKVTVREDGLNGASVELPALFRVVDDSQQTEATRRAAAEPATPAPLSATAVPARGY